MIKKIKEQLGNISLVRWLLIFGIIIVFCWCNIAIGIAGINIAVLANMAVCFLFLYLFVFWDKIKAVKGKWKKRGRNAVLILVGLLSACYIGISIPMAVHALSRTQDEAATVIVLGCKINGDQPSLMLALRLETAYAFLLEHPNSVCVVTGGQGADEIMPEGEAMKAYLVRRGLDEKRIYVEDKSTSTQENIKFAADIIEREGLNKNVVMATDDFHQWRSQIFGKQNGLTCASAGSCATPWYFLPYYWTREVFGVAFTLITVR